MRYALAVALCFTLSLAHAQYPSFGPQLPKQMKAGVWHALYRPQKSLDRVSLETLPFVSKVETAGNSAETKTIIHLRDWHFVTPEQFEADTPDGDYEKFLHDVETLQIEHITIMRCLAKHFGLTKLFCEGLTDSDMPIFHLKIKAMEKLEDELNGYEAELRKPSEADDEKVKLVRGLLADHRQSTLRLGIGWQLLRWKVIEEVLPLEDEDAFEAANPVKDGKVKIDLEANERREDEQAKRLMADDAKVVVLVLGGKHDLSDNLKRLDAKCRYIRLTTMGYEEAAK